MALTCDIIARCAFGTKINAFDDENNEFMKNLKQFGLEGVEIGPSLSVVSKWIHYNYLLSYQ